MEYSAPPDPIAGFGGRFAAWGRLGRGREGKGGGEGEGGGTGGEGKGGPQVTVEPGPLRALLCHCLVIVFVKNKIDINHGFQSALALIRQQQRDRKCLSTNDLPSK